MNMLMDAIAAVSRSGGSILFTQNSPSAPITAIIWIRQRPYVGVGPSPQEALEDLDRDLQEHWKP